MVYELPVNPPITQHLGPEPAPVITGFDGVPHAQSDPVPPGVHPPSLASKSSLKGNVEIGNVHCAGEI